MANYWFGLTVAIFTVVEVVAVSATITNNIFCYTVNKPLKKVLFDLYQTFAQLQI